MLFFLLDAVSFRKYGPEARRRRERSYSIGRVAQFHLAVCHSWVGARAKAEWLWRFQDAPAISRMGDLMGWSNAKAVTIW